MKLYEVEMRTVLTETYVIHAECADDARQGAVRGGGRCVRTVSEEASAQVCELSGGFEFAGGRVLMTGPLT
jgi:hypothetical protein